MANAKQARQQLSQDLGDYFVSTTSAAGGAAGITLKDAVLQDVGSIDKFITDGCTVFIAGGQSGGPTADQERGVPSGGIVTDTLTPNRAFTTTGTSGALIPSSIEYEINRLFTASEKNRAITTCLDLCFPVLFKRASYDLTMVVDQYDYSITAAGFYRNEPRQVHLVSSSDTELTTEMFAWEIRDGSSLHLNFRPIAGQTLRLFGITKPALSDIAYNAQLYILTARAAWYLYEQAIAGGPNDLVGRYTGLRDQARLMYELRKTQFQEVGMSATVRTDIFNQATPDIRWSTP